MPVETVRPATQWLLNMATSDVRALIFKRLNQVRSGNLGDYKSLGYDLFEFRIFYQTGYRIYFVRKGTHDIVLLCAGSKNTQKRDIDRARALQQIVKQTKKPVFCLYKDVIQNYISSLERAHYYINAHQKLYEPETISFEMNPILLKDLISVYGYVQISEMLGVTTRELFEYVTQSKECGFIMLDRLEQAFSFYLQEPLPRAVNQ